MRQRNEWNDRDSRLALSRIQHDADIHLDRLQRERTEMSQSINVFALVKDGQKYVFLYDDVSHDELLQTLGRYAADPELNFSWYDAAVISQRVRALKKRLREQSDDIPLRKSA